MSSTFSVKYLDDHLVDEEHEIKWYEKSRIFPSTFTGRGMETWHTNTCSRI